MISFTVYHADVASLSDKAVYEALYAQLPESRRRAADALRFEKDRLLSVGAGLLLQRALDDAGLPHTELRRGEHGKPFFAAYPDFHFNLSHSGTKVLCAVADRPVGCDAEKVTKANEALAKRFFAPEEFDALCMQPSEAARSDYFFRLWTLKESFLKATGRGLSLPLDAFCVRIGQDGISVSQEVDTASFGFYEPALDEGYRFACCLRDDAGKAPPKTALVDFMK